MVRFIFFVFIVGIVPVQAVSFYEIDRERERIVRAVKGGFFDVSNCYLRWGDLNYLRYDNGEPLLSVAIRSGRESMVALLLEKKADPNYGSFHGIMPFEEALMTGNPAIIALLLSAEACPRFKRRDVTLTLRAICLKSICDACE
jgi:ankyrin repeat protein